MAFIDRVVEFPGRVKLTNVSGDIYDMERAEGDEYTEGTLLNAANLNQQTQLDSAVESSFTTAGMIVGTYQNEVSDALNHLLDVQNTYGVAYNASSSITLGTSDKKIPLSTFMGNNCELSANGIKVKNSGIYKIEGEAYFSTGYTVNDIVHLTIYTNATAGLDFVKRAYSANPYEVICTGAFIKSLQAGDIVYLYARNQNDARGAIGTGGNTRLTLNRIY